MRAESDRVDRRLRRGGKPEARTSQHGLNVAASGDLFWADIGIPREVYRRSGIDIAAQIFGERHRVSEWPK